MKTVSKTSLINQNKVFAWAAIGTLVILVIPLVLTLLGSGVDGEGWNWKFGDFIFGFVMIFGFSSIFIFLARKLRTRNQRIIAALVVALVFMFVWAEFAVGIFTNLGS